MTPEAAITNEFQQTVTKLHFYKQLGKIFIDEAHLFSTKGDYRPTFRQLPLLTFLSAPFIAMMATAPEWITRNICANFFGPIRRLLMVRQDDTNRWNIAYTITNCNSSADKVAELCHTNVAR